MHPLAIKARGETDIREKGKKRGESEEKNRRESRGRKKTGRTEEEGT